MTISDLQTGVETLRGIPTGRQYRASNGRMKDETILVAYLRTAAGEEMTAEKWYALMSDAVEKENLCALLEKIENVCRAKCAWLKTEKEIHRYALECLSTEAFKAWTEFGGKPEEDGMISLEEYL